MITIEEAFIFGIIFGSLFIIEIKFIIYIVFVIINKYKKKKIK